MPRVDGRRADELRPIKIQRGFTQAPAGSVLIKSGETHILCTATVEEAVPRWREAAGLGWVTAEYEMLPSSTGERRARNRAGRIDGRTQEIQRLIGRSLRAVVDMKKLGERTIWLDCDVLQADGGTRTAAITGAYIALVDAVSKLRRERLIEADPIEDSIAAVSVGLVDDKVLLDLCYVEDTGAQVDFNVVMTGRGRFVEVQGTAESGTFSDVQMSKMLASAQKGIRKLSKIQQASLAGRGGK